MTGDASSDAPAPPPYREARAVGQLSRRKQTRFDLRPDAVTSEQIAAYLGLEAVRDLRFKGDIRPVGADGWQVSGRLTAVLAQPCVVSLETVEQYLDEPVERTYRPTDPDTGTIDVHLDDEDTDPLGDTIDLGQLLVETLALSADPYPRTDQDEREPMVYAPPGITPLTDEVVRPFSKLAALKDKLGGQES